MNKIFEEWNKEKIKISLKEISRKLGHSPKSIEIPSKLYGASVMYFGSLNKAKLAAGLMINKPKYNKIKESAYKLSENLAYVLGVVKGDGCAYIIKKKCGYGFSAGVALRVIDKDFALHFKKILGKWSGLNVKFIHSYTRENEWITVLYSIDAAKIVKNYNLNYILKGNKKIKYAFLKGLYDSEGGVIGKNLDNRKFSKRWIHFSNNNKKLIKLVSNLLNEFNIKHTIRSRIHSGFGSKKIQYEIYIHGKRQLYFYYKNIGFNIKRKQYKLKEVLKSYTVYDKHLFIKAQRLHRLMGYRKVAKRLSLPETTVYAWVLRNSKERIVDWRI